MPDNKGVFEKKSVLTLLDNIIRQYTAVVKELSVVRELSHL